MISSHTAPRVWDVMSRDVISVGPDDPRSEAAEELRLHHVANLPVVNEHMEVVGTIGPADLRRSRGRTVAQVMTRPASTIDEESPVTDAADLLLRRRLTSVPVVSHGKLVGRISRTGLVTFLCRHMWVCSSCGASQRGLTPPEFCPECGGPAAGFQLEDSSPGL